MFCIFAFKRWGDSNIKIIYSRKAIIEANKEGYYRALRATQKTIWTDKVNYEPWLTFFITSLQKQKRHLEEKITKVSSTTRYNKTEESIMALFDEKASWSVLEIAQTLNKNNETIKKNVQNLVKKDILEKQGSTKGVYYTLKR